MHAPILGTLWNKVGVNLPRVPTGSGLPYMVEWNMINYERDKSANKARN